MKFIKILKFAGTKIICELKKIDQPKRNKRKYVYIDSETMNYYWGDITN
jgi:hypothetical protein